MVKGFQICLASAAIILMSFGLISADDNLDRAISDKIMSLYNLDSNKTEIEIRKNKINAAPTEFDSVEVVSLTRSEMRGLIPFQLTFYKEGKSISSGQVRAMIAHFEQVLVTNGIIRRQDTIPPDRYEIKRMETTYLSDKPLQSPDELAGKWAKRNIGKEQILTAGMVEMIPMIGPGREVSMQFKTAGLEVTARGTALEPGYAGDIIRVRNIQSRKVIACTVLDAETVQVPTH